MPISDFNGNTFVAFIDISGFKKFMENRPVAERALNKFYNSGFFTIREYNSGTNESKVEGIFVSDSGILFVNAPEGGGRQGLAKLLEVIRKINDDMLSEGFMLLTSIAFGEFKYENRIEVIGTQKNAVFGNAYVSAFLDTETKKKKIKQGQCRLIIDTLTDDIKEYIEHEKQNNGLFSKRKYDTKHYYYYWMLQQGIEINTFEDNYRLALNIPGQQRFTSLLTVLRREYNRILEVNP